MRRDISLIIAAAASIAIAAAVPRPKEMDPVQEPALDKEVRPQMTRAERRRQLREDRKSMRMKAKGRP